MGLIDPSNAEFFLQAQREEDKVIDLWEPYLARLLMEHSLIVQGYKDVQDMPDLELLTRCQISDALASKQKEEIEIMRAMAQQG